MIKVKEESEKAGLKVNIKKTKIMEPCPFTSNRWGKMETVTDFIFLGSKVTAESDCSHEIKRCLFLGIKAMTKLDGILKSRDNCFEVHVVKGAYSQSCGFSGTYGWICQLDYKES